MNKRDTYSNCKVAIRFNRFSNSWVHASNGVDQCNYTQKGLYIPGSYAVPKILINSTKANCKFCDKIIIKHNTSNDIYWVHAGDDSYRSCDVKVATPISRKLKVFDSKDLLRLFND